jgi:hypothetical protein
VQLTFWMKKRGGAAAFLVSRSNGRGRRSDFAATVPARRVEANPALTGKLAGVVLA